MTLIKGRNVQIQPGFNSQILCIGSKPKDGFYNLSCGVFCWCFIQTARSLRHLPTTYPPFKERGGISGSYTLLSLLLGNTLSNNNYYLLPNYSRGQFWLRWTLSAVCLVWPRPVLPFANCFLLMAKSQSGFGFPSRKRFSFSSFLPTSHSVTGDAVISAAAFEGKDELPLRKRRACSARMQRRSMYQCAQLAWGQLGGRAHV